MQLGSLWLPSLFFDLQFFVCYTKAMSSVVQISQDILGGTPVFAGTRVPIQTLVDYLKAGDSIEEFLEGFPTVSRAQVISFLQEAGEHASKMAA
jgi:uncharacterized protein (DUF433 family)